MNTEMQAIIKAVADEYGITADDIISRKRQAHINEARQVAMLLCYALVSAHYTNIGREFKRTHCAVIHAIANIQALCEVDPALDNRCNRLYEQLS